MIGMIRRQEALAVEIETADVLPMREELTVSEEPKETPDVLIEAETDTSVVVEMSVVTEALDVPDAADASLPEAPEEQAEASDVVEMSVVTESLDVPDAADAALTEAPEEQAEASDVVEMSVVTEALDAVDAALPEVPEVQAEASEVGINVEHLRMTEALLFAASEPLSEEALKTSLPEGADVAGIIAELQKIYESRGVTIVRVAEKWQFRTAPDLAFLLRKEKPEQKRLSRAAIETLAIIAYHQPVTRAEIEDIRGVMLSKGTLDTLMEVGWIKIRGRKRTPGRPVTYGTTEAFLVQFGLENIGHLPGMDELKAAGFLEAIPPAGLDIPSPSDTLGPDEDPYDGEETNDLATGGADPFIPGSSSE